MARLRPWPTVPEDVRHGIFNNRGSFLVLLVQVAFVGAMVGVERTVLPVLAKEQFGLSSALATLSFILAFGLAKSPANFAAGWLADRFGRHRVLVGGWIVGLPVPLMVAFAPSWSWVIVANVLLGIQQGLCWSTTIVMKADVAGAHRRGLAVGLNEFAGYGGAAVLAYLTGVVAAAADLRTAPFLLGEAFAVLGLITAVLFAQETAVFIDEGGVEDQRRASYGPAAFGGISQAGFVSKLVDVTAWGLLPVYFHEHGLSIATVGLLAAAYPASWALLQPFTGAFSDSHGRRRPIVGGMLMQACGLYALVLAGDLTGWLIASVLLGAGTALAYPVLLATAGDIATPKLRASTIGHYRLWRDLGFVGGALFVGYLADTIGTVHTLESLAGLGLLSGLIAFATLPVPIPVRTPEPPGVEDVHA
ncbi:MAG: MFS transporter [Propionibacteriales bacterium]|nr:MFS transporter [Propionibacteriales bacterium]